MSGRVYNNFELISLLIIKSIVGLLPQIFLILILLLFNKLFDIPLITSVYIFISINLIAIAILAYFSQLALDELELK